MSNVLVMFLKGKCGLSSNEIARILFKTEEYVCRRHPHMSEPSFFSGFCVSSRTVLWQHGYSFHRKKTKATCGKKGNCNVRRTGKAALRKRVFADFVQKTLPSCTYWRQDFMHHLTNLCMLAPTDIFCWISKENTSGIFWCGFVCKGYVKINLVVWCLLLKSGSFYEPSTTCKVDSSKKIPF